MIDASQRCSNIDDCLAHLRDNERFAVAVSHRHAMTNPKLSYSMIYCFTDREQIYRYPVSMLIKKDHAMLDAINEHIQRAVEGGLLVKWLKDIDGKLNKMIDADLGPKKLTIEHISTAFMLYTIFGSLAVVAFIVELIVHPRASRPGASRIWKIVDMLIDGDRHFLHHVSPARIRINRQNAHRNVSKMRRILNLFKRGQNYD